MMLGVQFILQTITIHELCHCFNKTRSKVLFVIKLIKYLVLIFEIRVL